VTLPAFSLKAGLRPDVQNVRQVPSAEIAANALGEVDPFFAQAAQGEGVAARPESAV